MKRRLGQEIATDRPVAELYVYSKLRLRFANGRQPAA
jgi:hypothetical protein